jgi:carboxymethylenebutenolidase
MKTIAIDASDGSGQFSALVVEPAHTPAGAVIIIQEIFGVNAAMRAMAQHVAELGFIAIVPDLFWRLQPGVQLDPAKEEEWKQAFDLMGRFNQDQGIEDLKTTLRHARTMPGSNGRVGTMGFCLGGRLAFMMATRSDADVNVSYYGVGLEGLLDEVKHVSRPLLVHIAALDKFVPPEAQAKIVAATADHPHIRAYVYQGADHAFARIGGHHFHALSATIANGRSAEAFNAALG